MKIIDNVQHERQIYVYLDNLELNNLIITAVAAKAKISLDELTDRKNTIKCFISTKQTSTSASSPYAEVRINIPITESVPGSGQ